MPYLVLQPDGTTQEFATRAEAHKRASTMEPKPAIEFVLSEDARQQWRDRELSRLETGEYAPVPWAKDSWYRNSEYFRHYAHLSTKHEGLIAYTPDDEFGAADRQLRVKPGKYLQEFASRELNSAAIANYVARCKAFSGAFSIAITAEDIERVYVHGPDSCMSHSADYFSHTEDRHPTEPYGDSDLSVAYLGSIDRASARCIIWRDKMRFSRVYGDETLSHILRAAGYTYGSVSGAKVRALHLDNGAYLMPYVDGDGPHYAKKQGNWFVLGEGSYYTQNHGTSEGGITGELDTPDEDEDEDDRPICGTCDNRADSLDSHDRCRSCMPRCEHCNDRTDLDEDESYCRSCDDARNYCEGCEEDTWDEMTRIDGTYYCESCTDDRKTKCAAEDCDGFWFDAELDDDERDDRAARHVSHLCDDCASGIQVCQHCDESFSMNERQCEHCRMSVRCEHTIALPLECGAVHNPGTFCAACQTYVSAVGSYTTEVPANV